VKILLIVNDSPWGSSLAVTALRLLRSMLADGVEADAVYFRGEGVYNALPGRATDHGTPDLCPSWQVVSSRHDVPLLLCQSASRRRFDCEPGEGFRTAGLAEVIERMARCDHVLAF
jgi:sulfur relay (sulfurtransferase) complex TusBCD TusD component (DsrE family)